MNLEDVQRISKIKDEKKRRLYAKRAIEKISSSLRSYECFFQWPALFDSFKRDIEHLKTLE